MAEYSDVINFLSKKMRTGYDPSVLQKMIGTMKSSVAETGRGLGVSAGQRFKRFGSPVIDAYKAKLDRSRQQAVGRGITSISVAGEAEKTKAAQMLPQVIQAKKQQEMQEDQLGFEKLLSFLNPAMLLGGNLLTQFLAPKNDLTQQIIELFGGRQGGGGVA